FSFTAVEKRLRWHSLGHQSRDQAFEVNVEKPAFKVDNKAAKSLSLIKAESSTYTLNRSLSGNWKHRQKALLEAKAAGKLTIQARIEVVAANAKITAWVGTFDHSRLTEKPAKGAKDKRLGAGGTHGWDFAGPPKWVMRVGDRVKLTFAGGPAKTQDEALPKL